MELSQLRRRRCRWTRRWDGGRSLGLPWLFLLLFLLLLAESLPTELRHNVIVVVICYFFVVVAVVAVAPALEVLARCPDGVGGWMPTLLLLLLMLLLLLVRLPLPPSLPGPCHRRRTGRHGRSTSVPVVVVVVRPLLLGA